ncbi:MAG: arginine--tRNA ligase, partial [Candidatus Nealsonbacteria bacterium]|nr:arginine--tRNA ligase [Candidatus Nealsonbacteria bacterium]
MLRQEIKNLIEKVVKEIYGIKIEVKISQTENSAFGDYSTNIAMLLKKNPQEIVNAIESPILEKTEVKNGFINFFVSKDYLQKQVGEILKEKESFSKLKIGRGQKINVEFISANPTGPLTLGNGRGGFAGDVLANVLEKAGCKITREYYINDIGEQVRKLGHSIIGDAEAVYSGDYIAELRKRMKSALAKATADKIGEEAAKLIFKEMIEPIIKKMGIKFDVWFSEKSLTQEKDKVLDFFKKKNLIFENEGAIWFKSTKFGDDKDRVLIKADKEATYFLSDIAYLKNKFKRGFGRLIFFWGADHYGYIGRIKAAAEALGFGKEKIDIIIMQLVRLVQAGQEVKMSKRTGVYVTLDELINEVGLDAARFFFLARSSDSHLNFDLDLAKEQSEKNPVYYVQYAHARICSILRKSEIRNPKSETNSKLLNHESELNLIKKMIK